MNLSDLITSKENILKVSVENPNKNLYGFYGKVLVRYND